MEESKDPVIKLFGKTIQVPAVREGLATSGEDSGGYAKKISSLILRASSNKQDNHEPKHKNEETRISETNEEKNNPMDRTVKKPDKILPCPRCKSMETKFCYFNNYNVNQPRYFCKHCQRYWTEGGSMRNVPVGAGRRKSKSSTINHHHMTISDCAQADFCESINYLRPLKPNRTVLNFSFKSPLCESKDSNGEDQLSRSLVTPFYPMTPYLGMPWLCSSLNSTVLGKRSREENIAKSEKCLWLPKTSRINDDHDKAAKCSVWAKLKNISSEASQVLCANPAALSRSLNFHERS